MARTSSSAHIDAPFGLGVAAMLQGLVDNWWLILLRGVAAIVFGVLALVWPGITLIVLTILWGAYVLVDGALSLGAAIAGKGGAGRRWWLAIIGLAGIAAGALTLFWPGITLVVLLMLIAAWAIVTGVFEIVGAIRLRKEIDNEWALIVTGLLWVVFGVLMVVRPAAGARWAWRGSSPPSRSWSGSPTCSSRCGSGASSAPSRRGQPEAHAAEHQRPFAGALESRPRRT